MKVSKHEKAAIDELIKVRRALIRSVKKVERLVCHGALSLCCADRLYKLYDSMTDVCREKADTYEVLRVPYEPMKDVNYLNMLVQRLSEENKALRMR